MKKVYSVALLAALILTGCISGSEPPKKTRYMLTGGNAGASSATLGKQASGKVLRLAQVAVSRWLNTDAIYYQLSYQNDSQIAAYSESSWVSPPAAMLTDLIQNQLSATQSWKAVLGPGDSSRAAYTLRIQLADFQQDFTSPKQSHCLLTAKATLANNISQKIAGQKSFRYKPQAPSPDAAGGVKCLDQASLRFANDLQSWLQSSEHVD